MNRRLLQMRLASLKVKLADLEAELLAEELYAKGVNKDQTEYSPVTNTPYGEGFFGKGKTNDTTAKKDYNELYYEVNHDKKWDVKEYGKLKKNKGKK